MNNPASSQNGFTIIELLVVMGIIAVLASIVLIALNPAKYFAQARNTQRTTNVIALLDAVGQNMAENKGILTCDGNANIPDSFTTIKSGAGGYNLAACLVPNFMSTMPIDPSTPGGHYGNNGDYDTGYNIMKDSVTGRISVAAPYGELGEGISISR